MVECRLTKVNLRTMFSHSFLSIQYLIQWLLSPYFNANIVKLWCPKQMTKQTQYQTSVWTVHTLFTNGSLTDARNHHIKQQKIWPASLTNLTNQWKAVNAKAQKRKSIKAVPCRATSCCACRMNTYVIWISSLFWYQVWEWPTTIHKRAQCTKQHSGELCPTQFPPLKKSCVKMHPRKRR